MTSHYPNPDQSQPSSDLPAAGAAALKMYLDTCEKNAIVPDVGGAWANAFRAGADYAAQAMTTQAGPATWDLIEQLVQLECSRERLHMEYMGKAMPADVYLRFQKLRDERIPALQVQLRAAIPSAPVCESVHTAEPGIQATAAAQPIERALRKVLAAVQRYLPPDGISIDAAMSEIITAIDPWPGAGTSGAPDQPPADFAHAYADQLMLRCMVPDESAPQAQPADALDAEIAKLKKAYQELGNMFHDQIVAQQAAWIEWQHGAGAEAGMQWIENGLCGPGHIPDEDEPYGTEAQAYFDANKSDPFPACHCGRPSNSLWMGKGFCSNAHYNEHRAAMAAAQEGGAAPTEQEIAGNP